MKKQAIRLLLVVLICIILTGCSEEDKEKKIITNKALDYISTKYNVDVKNIQIKDNKLYGNSTVCLKRCPSNEIELLVNNEVYKVSFDRKTNTYSDNKEVEKIVNDYMDYIKNSLKVIATITIEDEEKIRVTEKYNGNIKEFLKNNDLTAILIVESKTQEEAILNWRTYSLDAITALEDLDITYNLRFSVIENEKEIVIYNYKSTKLDNKFKVEDNINNIKLECDRDKVVNSTCRNK